MDKNIVSTKYQEGISLTYGKEARLDDIDWRILDALAQNARLSISQITRKTGIKRDVVKYRLSKMIEKDVITAFLTVANFPKMGYNTWGQIRFTFKDLTPKREKEFLNYVKNAPEISFAFSCFGAQDFGVEFYAKNPEHLQELVKNFKNKFSDIIKDTETMIFIKVFKMRWVPVKK